MKLLTFLQFSIFYRSINSRAFSFFFSTSLSFSCTFTKKEMKCYFPPKTNCKHKSQSCCCEFNELFLEQQLNISMRSFLNLQKIFFLSPSSFLESRESGFSTHIVCPDRFLVLSRSLAIISIFLNAIQH